MLVGGALWLKQCGGEKRRLSGAARIHVAGEVSSTEPAARGGSTTAQPPSIMPNDPVRVRAPEAPRSSKLLDVTSSSIEEGATVDTQFVFTGCGGKNVSPQLGWRGAPAGTKSFAITCFDPDAPTGSGYWHWVVFDIPASVTRLEAGAGTGGSPGGGQTGYNDFGVNTYAGPCPPNGDEPHHYIFTVYALDVPRIEGAGKGTTGATLIFQMRGHVLAAGRITGRFGM